MPTTHAPQALTSTDTTPSCPPCTHLIPITAMDTTGLLCAPARRPTGLSVDRENMRTMPSVQPRANTGQGSSGESWELLACTPGQANEMAPQKWYSQSSVWRSRLAMDPQRWHQDPKHGAQK
eukprot:1158106-Pelagomonas_calceolata.AAC.4